MRQGLGSTPNTGGMTWKLPGKLGVAVQRRVWVGLGGLQQENLILEGRQLYFYI